MTAQQQADREGRTLCRVTAFGVPYVVRAAEAMLWEWVGGELIFPVGGERYSAAPPPPWSGAASDRATG